MYIRTQHALAVVESDMVGKDGIKYHMITSTSNAQVKAVVQLQKKAKEREAKKLFVIEGWKLFEEIKRDAPTHIEKTYVTEEFLQQSGQADLVKGMEYELVSPEVMQTMAETMRRSLPYLLTIPITIITKAFTICPSIFSMK